MNTRSLHFQAQHVTQFVFVQCIALVGWIIIQLLFSLSPLGRALPLVTLLCAEAVWWMALLLVMLWLFLREYHRFVRSALELEDANRRLRQRTNSLLEDLRKAYVPTTNHETTSGDK